MKKGNPPVIAGIIESGSITANEVKAMQRMIYVDGIIDRSQAEWLISVRRATRTTDEAFRSLYLEALVDYLVYQERPTGVVTDEAADWLLSKLSTVRALGDTLDLDLVAMVIAEATRCSEKLVSYRDGCAGGRSTPRVIEAAERFALSA
jgi:hypothetical protein